MKVLLVIDSLCAGGAQRQMCNLAAGLRQSGHDVYLFHYYPHLDHFRRAMEEAGVTIVDIHKRKRFSLRPLSALIRLYRSIRPDVVISFLDTPNVYALLASLFRRPPILVVSERWTFVAGSLSVLARMRYQLYRLATAITVNSYHHGEALCSRFPYMAGKIRIIYNGVDLKRFSPASARAEDGVIKLLAVGSLLPQKNAGILIDALSIVRNEDLDVAVTWLGRVDQSDEMRAEYAARTEQLKDKSLRSCWTWAGESDDVETFINAADAVVHPSLVEGLPNVICEAMACGKPVLAGDVGDHGRLLGERLRGLLFDATSDESMAAAILYFARLPLQDRNQMGRNGREYAEQALDLERFVDEYAALARCEKV